jgi:hypothetical protein
MSPKPLITRRVLNAFAVAMLLATVSAEGSILTFRLSAGGADAEQLMPQTYGDNIKSATTDFDDPSPGTTTHRYEMGNGFTTADVKLGYSTPAATGTSTLSFRYHGIATGSVAAASKPGGAYLRTTGTPTSLTDRKFDFTFTPDFAYTGIKLNSFQIADFVGYATGHTVDWAVYAGSTLTTPLASGQVISPANTATTVNTGLGYFVQNTVILRIQHTAGTGDDLIVDNINFDAPEPTGAALVLLALVPQMLRRRRR